MDRLYARQQGDDFEAPTDVYCEVRTRNRTTVPIPCEIYQKSAYEIIPSLRNQHMQVAIERLQIDTTQLPMWIPIPLDPATSTANTIYEIFITYNNSVGGLLKQGWSRLQFTKDSTFDVLPATTTDFERVLDGDAMFVKSCHKIADMINRSLVSAVNMLVAVGGADCTPLGFNKILTCHVPLCWWDTSRNKFVFSSLSDFWDANTTVVANGGLNNGVAVGPMKLYFNRALKDLMRGYLYEPVATIVHQAGGTPTTEWWQLKIFHDANPYNATSLSMATSSIVTYNTYSAGRVLHCVQDQSALSVFQSIIKLVVTSDNLDVQSQAMPPRSGWGTVSTDVSTRTLKVLGEISYPVDDTVGPPSNTIQYLPINLRFVDIGLYQPVKDIHVKVWWMDIFGNLHPLRLGQYDGMSMTLHFKKI